jgi:hypothetical protein
LFAGTTINPLKAHVNLAWLGAQYLADYLLINTQVVLNILDPPQGYLADVQHALNMVILI